MEMAEIKDLLVRMGALDETSDAGSIDSFALLQDPIVSNRLAVELLQRIDRDAKPELVVAPEGYGSYFGYSIALAAWTRFLPLKGGQDGSYSLPEGLSCKRNERVIVVLDEFDKDCAQVLVSMLSEQGAKPVAVLSLLGSSEDAIEGCPCFSLLA